MPDCEICSSQVVTFQEDINWKAFDCRRCGRWQRSNDSYRQLNQLDWTDPSAVNARSRLSHIVRRNQEQLNPGRRVELPARLESWNLSERMPSPAEQLDNLIVYVGQHQPSYAESAPLAIPAVAAWIGARIVKGSSEAGVGWLLEQPTNSDFFDDRGDQNGRRLLRLTMKGWSLYEAVTRAQVESRRVLMAMKFNTKKLDDPQLDELVAAFQPAVARAGFDL
jgi:hypothetical protein